jgi:2-polyprenyl-3-methyl-5-hydroxy-6-metoxy-1,4-benzoquinol methylase
LYPEEAKYIEPVVCSEYSAEMQLHVLQLNANAIMEPVLDIGCGKNGNLVSFLCEKGIFIQGIDRIAASTRNLINADWLEYDYGNEKLGANSITHPTSRLLNCI